jgi:hypothetical protein
MKDNNIFELLDHAHQLLLDHPKPIQDLIYWACTLDDEARTMLIMAYRNLNEGK